MAWVRSKRILEIALVTVASAVLLTLIGISLMNVVTVQSQPTIPNELVSKDFVEVKFESPPDWKSSLQGGCMVYAPKGGRAKKVVIVRPDGKTQEHLVDSSGTVTICGERIHIDTIGGGL